MILGVPCDQWCFLLGAFSPRLLLPAVVAGCCCRLSYWQVWQDQACWNIEISQVYPQFSLAAVNKLEKRFVERIKWDLYIKQSLYAQ